MSKKPLDKDLTDKEALEYFKTLYNPWREIPSCGAKWLLGCAVRELLRRVEALENDPKTP